MKRPLHPQRAFSFVFMGHVAAVAGFSHSLARSKNILCLIEEHHSAQLHGSRLLFALHNWTVLAYININRRETGDPAVPRT
ncbi:hypothetical protein [Rhizobium leguminosarum]|uniref:hypothetical protein n=1 Tax=Rhizobium leguminosarum TaxID=384 RepID=UPI001249F573|nr:hypothetical protein [Rhizobium leguminosarum]